MTGVVMQQSSSDLDRSTPIKSKSSSGLRSRSKNSSKNNNFTSPDKTVASTPPNSPGLSPTTAEEEAVALLATQDQDQVDNVYQLVDAEGNYVSRQDPDSAGAEVSRPRQQSATRANRNRSRSQSLSAPPPVIADEHIPHVAVRILHIPQTQHVTY